MSCHVYPEHHVLFIVYYSIMFIMSVMSCLLIIHHVMFIHCSLLCHVMLINDSMCHVYSERHVMFAIGKKAVCPA